jgi:hypothetical protein
MSYDNQLNQMNELDALLLPTNVQTAMTIGPHQVDIHLRYFEAEFKKLSPPQGGLMKVFQKCDGLQSY